MYGDQEIEYKKHVYEGECFVSTDPDSRGNIEFLQLSSFSCDSVLGLRWLPDMEIFEGGLLAVITLYDGTTAFYHSGSTYYGIQTTAHIAGLAAAAYNASKPGGRSLNPMQMRSQADKLKKEINEMLHFRKKGYYIIPSLLSRDYDNTLLWPGAIYKKDLYSRDRFRAWTQRNNIYIEGL